MRLDILYNPGLLCERLAKKFHQRSRLRKLRHTPARNLALGHIDSLELLELVRKSGIKVIYDIGAHIGTWVLLAKSIIPEAMIEAFEPLPAHQSKFYDNLTGLDQVQLHRIALGSENTLSSIHVTDFSDASSLLPLAQPLHMQFGINEVTQLKTTVRRLDDYYKEQNLAPPDLIKLDVQGYELEVLKGASECLRTAKAILTEVSFIELYQGQCTFPEIVSFMYLHDFHLLAYGYNTPVGKSLLQADALFVKKGYDDVIR